MMEILNNVSLREHNTFAVDVKTQYFVEIHNKQELLDLSISSIFKENNCFVLGNGANVLFTKDFDGLIIKSAIKYIKIVMEDDNFAIINVGSGTLWNDFVDFCVERGYSGMENLTDIPSLCGSAVVQNIGAYGMEISNIVENVIAVSLSYPHKEIIFSNADCNFSYRSSIFKQKENINKYFITNVTFKVCKNFVPVLSYKDVNDYINKRFNYDINLTTVRNSVSEIRKEKLPNVELVGNAGSFFKNPVIDKAKYQSIIDKYNLSYYSVDDVQKQVKLSAAQLIELSGLKGFRIKDAGVFEKHSLILCNYGNATGYEVYSLANIVISKVYELFNVVLEPEVIIL